MKVDLAPDGAMAASSKPTGSEVIGKPREEALVAPAGEVARAHIREGESGTKEAASASLEATSPPTAVVAADPLAALGVQICRSEQPTGSVSSRVEAEDDAVLKAAERERQDRVFSAAAAALEAPLCPAAAGRPAEVGTPAGSASACSEERSVTDSGDILASGCAEEKEALFAAVAASSSGDGEGSPGNAEPVDGKPGLLGREGGRRKRTSRRAASSVPIHQRPSVDEEASLALRHPESSRVVSRLPGVKFCPSRNAWIARWSEEGQERWKTFSVKACKGFCQAHVQAVQFRWEKVRMKYAKLMKQASPQPGLIASHASDGTPEALDMDAEAAEFVTALQMYGNGSHVRIPRNKSNTATSLQRGRSRSPPDSARSPSADADVHTAQTRHKRQRGSLSAPKLAVGEPELGAVGTGSGLKKHYHSPAHQQQQQREQQQRQPLRGTYEQLSPSQWALLKQHLQLQSARDVCSSSSKLAGDAWPDEDSSGAPRSGPCETAPTSRAGGSSQVRSDPVRGPPSTEAADTDSDSKAQLFLQVAKRLQQSSDQQDASLVLQALKAMLQSRSERQEEVGSRGQQQQQLLQLLSTSSSSNSNDVGSELLRLAATSAGLLGAASDRDSNGAVTGMQQSGGGHQVCFSTLGNKEIPPHSQPWSDSISDKGLADSVQTLSRILADDSRSAPAASDSAGDATARPGASTSPQWVATPVARAPESHGGVSLLAQQGTQESPLREPLEGGRAEESVDLQPWRRAVCVILEDVLENCILEVGSQQRQGSPLLQERLQFAPMVGRLKALAAKSCSKSELRPFLRLFARSIRLGLMPSKQSEDVQQLILDALGALDDALANSRSHQQSTVARGSVDAETSSFCVIPAGNTFS